MRVFVTGTGRCGTVTFARACGHITNFTSGHETRAKRPKILYPDNHIEVDPHLVWRMGELIETYPKAFYVFLYREPNEVKASMAKRPSMKVWGRFAFMNPSIRPSVAARSIHDSAIAVMAWYKGSIETQIAMHTPIPDKQWLAFTSKIGAQGNAGAQLAELKKKYNASRR